MRIIYTQKQPNLCLTKKPAGVAAGLMTLDGLSSCAGCSRYDWGGHLHANSMFTLKHFVLAVDLQAGAAPSNPQCSASCLTGVPRQPVMLMVM